MPNLVKAVSALSIFFFALTLNLAATDNPSKTKPSDKQAAADAAKEQAKKDQEEQLRKLERRIAAALLHEAKKDQGDYVPCIFTKKQLMEFRLESPSTRLTEADAEKLVSSVMDAVLDKENDELVDALREFTANLTPTSFAGLTPSQALTKIIVLLQKSQRDVKEISTWAGAAQASDDQLAYLVADSIAKGADLTQLQRSQLMGELKDKADPSLKADQKLTKIREYLWTDFASAVVNADPNLQPAQRAKQVQVFQKNAPAAQEDLSRAQAITPNAQNKAARNIIDTARKSIASFERPDDVGCAMSILDWNEARYAFGRGLADEYIAVQVTVRNLNLSEDFLLHDVELAVDSDPGGRYGRFYSGRDKIIVRALSNTQQDYSPRNFLVHTTEAIGTVMSAVIPVAGESFAAATGVFNGGFLPGLRRTWADHTVNQMNLISDIGFSSSMTYKTVVPKTGAAMFVTFIPAKQFEEGWWTQKCARNLFIGPKKQNKTANPLDFPLSDPQPQEQASVDVRAAIEYCRDHGASPDQKRRPSSDEQPPALKVRPPALGGQSADSSEDNGVYIQPERVRYSKWTPTSLGLFRELAFVAISGTHIQEKGQNNPVIGQLDCPETESGDLDFLKATGDSLSCDLSGQNLDKVANLVLRNADSPTDTKTASGTVSVSGDTNSAKVLFKLDDLGGLPATVYNVYSATKEGVENDVKRVVHLSPLPFLKDISPKGIDSATLSSSQPPSLTLTGYHLDKLQQIRLTGDSLSASYLLKVSRNKGVVAAFAAKDWAKFAKLPWNSDGSSLVVQLMSGAPATDPIQTNQVLIVTGKSRDSTESAGSGSDTANGGRGAGENTMPLNSAKGKTTTAPAVKNGTSAPDKPK